MLDGRRIWLVGGRIDYTRVVRESWADRIHAARLAGLNTVETTVVWSRHEPRPGKFDFEGENDLRHFVGLVGRAGMHCILRVGPYVGSRHDLGGLPPWLLENPAIQLRTNHPPFLEASSRYLTALSEQVRDLQVTAPGAGGPILMVQLESSWTCAFDALADAYLGELSRYLREGGIDVPVLNDHNLWQSAEGQVDCWSGYENLLAMMRQLALVRPDQPRLVVDFNLTNYAAWGQPAPTPLDQWQVQRRLAEVLAGAAQFNIQPFFGGTNFGFSAGRSPDGTDLFVCPSDDQFAPLRETGAPGPAYRAVRRIATFASRFHRVLSHLDPTYQPVVIDPAAAPATPAKGKKAAPQGCRLVHVTGSQGGVVFVFGDEAAHAAGAEQSAVLLLPDGTNLTVRLGGQPVAWCLMDAALAGRSRLDYTNLNAFAVLGRILVLFGPAGSRGVVSINGSPMEADVPSEGARAPFVHEHETTVVVVCSEEQIDATFLTDEAVYVNAAGLTGDGKPIALPGAKNCTRIGLDGIIKQVPALVTADERGASTTVAHWQAAPMSEYAAGTSPRFAKIPGPADLTSLGGPHGYGWYAVDLEFAGPRKVEAAFPHGGDRLHCFVAGADCGIAGFGPGAAETVHLPVKKGVQRLVVLAENLGRYSGGPNLWERKGLFGHIWEVSKLKAGAPKIVKGDPIEILAYRAPLWETRKGDCTSPFRVTWHLHRKSKKSSLLLRVASPRVRALLILDDAVAGYIDRSGPATIYFDAERLGRANNTLQLALVPDAASNYATEAEAEEAAGALRDVLRFEELEENLSEKAQWLFAKWEPPAESAFSPWTKAGKAKGPTWWRGGFKPSSSRAPCFLELDGLTKGQVYVNGRHLCRYFVAAADGAAVPPQERYFVPATYLKPGEENELLIFDEHGGSPTKLRVVWDSSSRPITASPRAAH